MEQCMQHKLIQKKTVKAIYVFAHMLVQETTHFLEKKNETLKILFSVKEDFLLRVFGVV